MAKSKIQSFTIAAVQDAPVFLDRERTVAKATKLIAEAAKRGAKLIVFPEAFVPAYPDWVWAMPPSEVGLHQELYARLVENAVDVPGDETDALCAAARRAKAAVAIGVNERNIEASGSSLYNTLLYIGPDGALLGKHRKLVPTAAERLVWAQGDGSTMDVYDLPIGRVGGLICWENYMPLARYAMYAWGTQIYLAPTWDRGSTWTATLQHIAKEGRCYVVGCCMALRKDDIPDHFEFKQRYYKDAGEWINIGDSAIVDPNGNFIVGPSRAKREVLYAEIDPAQYSSAKWMFDGAGHYARPDVFELTVNRSERPLVVDGGHRSNEDGSKFEVRGSTDGVRKARVSKRAAKGRKKS
jgi:nitrilase